MMTGRGRRVVLYSGEQNEAPCDEHVSCISEARRQEFFGPLNESDLDRGGFDWNATSPWWVEHNARAIAEISQRCEQTDLLCLIAGQAQGLIADTLPALTVAEWGVGYEGILNVGGHQRIGGPAYAAFESIAFRHLLHGIWNNKHGRWHDTVIPNFFDPDEFPEPDEAARLLARDRGDYLLFAGRLIEHKGPAIAARIAQELGMKLVVAGPGALDHGPGFVQSQEVRIEAPDLEYVGTVGWRERSELMHGAKALLMPTTYIEPFGGVAVEAMMCGTPVVSTDFGAFTETVVPGITGYRFNMLAEGIEMTKRAMELDRAVVRAYAHSHFSLDAVAPMFERWFDTLDGLWTGGWDELPTTS